MVNEGITFYIFFLSVIRSIGRVTGEMLEVGGRTTDHSWSSLKSNNTQKSLSHVLDVVRIVLLALSLIHPRVQLQLYTPRATTKTNNSWTYRILEYSPTSVECSKCKHRPLKEHRRGGKKLPLRSERVGETLLSKHSTKPYARVKCTF